MPTKKYITDHAIKIDGLDSLPIALHPLLRQYKIVLIGETHGTQEAPLFCLGLIKLLEADKSGPILLALEISETEQPIFDEFMLSGYPTVFKDSPLFTDKQQYGLSSEAMVQMLRALRSLDHVKVICSLSRERTQNQDERDFKWASNILRNFCAKEAIRVVVLGGAFHMALTPQHVGDSSLKTMGYYLLQSDESPLYPFQVLSIDIKSKEVNAWGCHAETIGKDFKSFPLMRCGEYQTMMPDNNYSNAVDWNIYFLMETSIQDRHNATLFVRKTSASYPLFH